MKTTRPAQIFVSGLRFVVDPDGPFGLIRVAGCSQDGT
jgi:hypothetical protein